MTNLRSRLTLAAVPLVLAAFLTGCGGDESSNEGTGGSEDGSSVAEDAGVEPGDLGAPEECAEAFPMAFGDADIDDVSMMPADWPEPVDDAVLCSTSGTIGDAVESAEFATSLPEEEVLSSFESALGDLGYTVSRGDSSGLDRAVLAGTAGEVAFEITAVPGGYTVVFAKG